MEDYILFTKAQIALVFVMGVVLGIMDVSLVELAVIVLLFGVMALLPRKSA